MNKNKNISIVIATADRSRCVLDCVESFKSQVPENLELIVVDAGSDDPVDEGALKEIWANSRVLRSRERNASIQRNMGVGAAAGDIIIFLDDDTIVNSGWWPVIIDPLADPKVGVVQGGIHSSKKPHLRSDRGGYVKWSGFTEACLERGENAPREIDSPMTTNMAVHKSVYEAVGGLAPIYVVYDEDVDFGLKVRKAGWKIIHEPRASVYHYGHRIWRPPATKQAAFRKGRNRSILLVRNYGLFSRLMFFVVIAPFWKFFEAVQDSARFVFKSFGHAAAYVLGVFAGVVVGLKHPVDEDTLDK